MLYTENRTCSSCFRPWIGIGSTCNECRQTHLLNDINKRSLNTTVYNNSSSYSSAGQDWGYTPPYVGMIIFAIVCWLLWWFHFPPARIIVNLIKFIIWMPIGLVAGWTPDFSM